MDHDSKPEWGESDHYIPHGPSHRGQSHRSKTMAQNQLLTAQLQGMERLVDADTGAILMRHPSLRGIPDLVLEGDGYTLEFIGPTLLCVDIRNPEALIKLMAEPFKAQLPAGVQ